MDRECSRKFRTALTATERLNFQQIPAQLHELAAELSNQRFQVWLVGGAVRDLLWGHSPQDWDLATDALPEQVEATFPETIPTGKKFGTITVLYRGLTVEVTTFRADFDYSGRRPAAVHFGTEICTDLARRDFTINALAYDFETGELVDPFGGRKDAGRRILRAVGDPAVRFAEDGLRMFRFYRFLATHDLTPDRATVRAINPTFAQAVSLERIRDEFSKLLIGKRVRPGLQGLTSSGLMDLFLPELAACRSFQLDFGRKPTTWEHLLATVEQIRPDLPLRLAALLHDLAKPESFVQTSSGIHFYGHDQAGARQSEVILHRLKFPQKLVEMVETLIRNHMFQLPASAGDSAVRRLIAKVGPELMPDLLELRRADIIATGRVDYQTWEHWEELVRRVQETLKSQVVLQRSGIAVNGRDLMERLGLKPGPLVGKILDMLWEEVLEDPVVNRKEILLEMAESIIKSFDSKKRLEPKQIINGTANER